MPSRAAPVAVIGGGLAGSEAAWQLAARGVDVHLVEMKPGERSPAHVGDGLAELVCSNSLRGASLDNAVGLIKEELRRAGSLLLRIAGETAVPAGRALAVDRRAFSSRVEAALAAHPRIAIERRRADALPEAGLAIVATGPLTAGPLAEAIDCRGARLAYHDAIAPLVSADGIDFDVVFRADRYEGTGDAASYLNCPLERAEYDALVAALVAAEKTPLHAFESAPFFEGCLPIEEMARRGPQTLAHGPLKPVGLVDPRTGRRPFAVVQLRPEDAARTAYNLVGFQTRLRQAEQARVVRMIPGLGRAAIERYGQVHRNTFVDAPACLDDRMRLLDRPEVALAGQLTGVEGYVESIASGLVVGISTAALALDRPFSLPPPGTALGGLMRHTRRGAGRYQPSNVVWAMIDCPERPRGIGKRDHRQACAERALADLAPWIAEHAPAVS
ncbi:MAG: methylenetetrahydrofolate--tRNA-(uracil(54)-C(5))-methyltransferase (FADH(2)-oxidizing) TrmFO [Proteobacteria bacterium]|jgi:methylenetetrahydrofolate--tRNA-(uracil-5-)-methyltransferase|nr:methylenetetrahydrofolate--tRNA-(uracil(54)-C(5))-methyltransferase (FADH(2)-oxidizing) TrmFO [Pseudomonadota bacterium]